MDNKVWRTVRKYENVWLYIGFLIVAGFLAAARGCGQEFFGVLFFPIMIPVLLSIAMLVGCAWTGANGRILLVVQIMLALAALMRAVLWVSYPDLFEGSKLTIPDYLLAEIVILIVVHLYPMKTSLKDKRVYEILASKKFTIAMVILVIILYAVLYVFGTSYGGVKAWFTIGGFSIQLTEFIKVLFVICLAAIMSRDRHIFAAFFFYIINAVAMAYFSELGTLIVMTFVFFIFLFVFPSPDKRFRHFLLGGIPLLFLLGLGIVIRVGSNDYEYALKQSDSRVFAATFAGNLYNYAMETPDDVVTMDILDEMITKSLESMNTDKQAELGRAFHSISKQITDGKLGLSDFQEARDSHVLEKVADIIYKKTENGISEETVKRLAEETGKYPAIASLARLCEDSGFREAYITQFCRSDYYNTDLLRSSAPPVSLKPVKKIIRVVYSKFVERAVLPHENIRARFGFTSGDIPYQLSAAQSAMQVGGLAGAEKHEFFYVPVMESDMIFAEMVSLYGFGMGFFVILLYMILFREGMKETAKLREKPFHRGLALGIPLMIFIQALVIIAGNLNLFPLTGITLPFIADGTISLLIFALMIGILLAVSYVPIVEKQEADRSGTPVRKRLSGLRSLPGRIVNTGKGIDTIIDQKGGRKSENKKAGKKEADSTGTTSGRTDKEIAGRQSDGREEHGAAYDSKPESRAGNRQRGSEGRKENAGKNPAEPGSTKNKRRETRLPWDE